MLQALVVLIAVWGAAAAHKIAIVGAGIGAASTALHLRELIHEDIDIDVFELSDTLGGRVSSIAIEDHLIEMGASIIHTENRLVIKMAQAANLTLANPQGSEAGLFALFDGTRVVFRQSPWRIITFINLLWSYGFQPWYYRTTAAAFLQQFVQVYDLMNQGIAFSRPYDLLRKLDLFNLTQQSFRQFIRDTYGLYSRFAAEFVAAASKVNYNQENFQLNALAGLVSLLPATDSRLYTIKEGNQELINRTLSAAGAHVHLKTAVLSIAALDNGQFGVGRISLLSTHQDTSSISSSELYDAVVIAAPLTDPAAAAELISGVKLPFIPQRDYQTTVVTIVKGAVRPTFFGLPPGRMPYDSVLVTEVGTKVPFNSLTRVAATADFKGLYKLFSKKPVPRACLSMIFDTGYSVVANRTWDAYPLFDPPESFPPFQLAEGLYYTAAWESAASAMEMAAIGGKNVALLFANHLQEGKTSGSAMLKNRGNVGRIKKGGGGQQALHAAAAA